jgi:hypothetical protein
MTDDDLDLGEKVPNTSESSAVGAPTSKIKRNTPEFDALKRNNNSKIEFKDEEGTGADRMMTAKLKVKTDSLADLVQAEWSGVKLRVTEAWDEDDEHSANSTHYEARGIDMTTHPRDPAKYGRLGRLAVNAGFDWVWYEDQRHVHASMKK